MFSVIHCSFIVFSDTPPFCFQTNTSYSHSHIFNTCLQTFIFIYCFLRHSHFLFSDSHFLFSDMCNPKCEHNGTCISPDICLCLDGFSGKRCEKGNIRAPTAITAWFPSPSRYRM